MSDTSNGEGWWVASDGKWYSPEQHPDHVASVEATPLAPATQPSQVDETVNVPAHQTLPAATNPAQNAPGPTFAAATTTEANIVATVSGNSLNDASSDDTASTGGQRKLVLGLVALVLVGGLAFLAVRAFGGGSGAAGAASPEAAVQQLISSVNENDGVGFVEVFDPDEVEAWFGSFGPAIEKAQALADESETADDVGAAYSSLFTAFDFSLTGSGGDDPTYEVEMLDNDGRISRVRIDGLDLAVSVDDVDTAIIGSADNEVPSALDITRFDGAQVFLRDERGGLRATSSIDNGPTQEEFADDVHLDIVTVEKNGKWYISIGYTLLDGIHNAGGFSGFEAPDYGAAFALVEDQTGGAASPEEAVQEFFSALENLDYETMIRITDPLGTPYLHDFQPLIDEQIAEDDRRQSVRDIDLRFDDIELSVSDWNDRTLVTFTEVSGRSSEGAFEIDAATWCASLEDDFGFNEACLEDGIAELLREIDSRENPRDFIPEQTGMVVVERNGRWYLDPLGTWGYYTDQLAEVATRLSEDLQAQLESNDDFDDAFGNFFFVEGAVARLGQPVIRDAEDGQVGVALDLSDLPTVRQDSDEYSVAAVLVRTTGRGEFVNPPSTLLTGDDWVLAYDRVDDEDLEIPAVGARTDGSLDVELFEVEVIEVGVDGLEGQLGGQGRPQIVTFTDEARQRDVEFDGVEFIDIYPSEDQGLVFRTESFFARAHNGNTVFTVISGDPGALFSIDVIDPASEPVAVPESTPDPDPTPAAEPPVLSTEFDDPIVEVFAEVVEAFDFNYVSEQAGGYFDGCGPDDPDVTSYSFGLDDTTGLVLITNYPSVSRASEAFDDLRSVASPCEAFPSLVVNSVTEIDDENIRIEWAYDDDPESVAIEHYRLTDTTVLVAASQDEAELLELVELIAQW